MLCPPAEVKYGELIHENHEKIEVLHLFRCVTHTDIYIYVETGGGRERERERDLEIYFSCFADVDVHGRAPSLHCRFDLLRPASLTHPNSSASVCLDFG